MKRLYSLVLIIAVLICSIAPSNPASAQNRSSVLSSLGIVSTSERIEYGVLIKDTVYADAAGVAAGLFVSSDNIYFKGVGNEYLISDGAVSFYRIYERIYYYDSSSYSSSSYRGQTSSHTLDSAYPW